MKLVWENDRPIPSAKDTKSHSRHYVPQGKDAFQQTYDTILSVGALGLQARFNEDYQDIWRQKIAEEMVDELFAGLYD